jgi:hypothetical protein
VCVCLRFVNLKAAMKGKSHELSLCRGEKFERHRERDNRVGMLMQSHVALLKLKCSSGSQTDEGTFRYLCMPYVVAICSEMSSG